MTMEKVLRASSQRGNRRVCRETSAFTILRAGLAAMNPQCIDFNVGPSNLSRLVDPTTRVCEEFDQVAALRLTPGAGVENSGGDPGQPFAIIRRVTIREILRRPWVPQVRFGLRLATKRLTEFQKFAEKGILCHPRRTKQ
jgi:hypothetical protein